MNLHVHFTILLAALVLAAGCGREDSRENVRDRHRTPGASAERGVASRSAALPADSLVFAFYNVENLFDLIDDPTKEDEEFTPEGKLEWTAERLDRKFDGVARVIRSFENMKGADLVGLCEVENRYVLERLVNEFLPRETYEIVHAESPDVRGIDVALLYRSSKMHCVGHRMHRVDLGDGERPTRDVLEVAFEREGKRFTVLVNHWPSRSGGEEESAPKRMVAAGVVASVVDSLRDLDPLADIVVMGDFNDEPFNESIVAVTGAGAAEGKPARNRRLFNLAAPVAFDSEAGTTDRSGKGVMPRDTVGTYMYRGSWELIDQIMVSHGLFDDRGLVIGDRGQGIFHPDFLRDFHPSQPHHPPRRTYVQGNRYIGGTSDHFPVYAVFGWK